MQCETVVRTIVQSFTQGRSSNPFELPHVHATGQLEALSTLPNRNRLVVLAPSATLQVRLLLLYGCNQSHGLGHVPEQQRMCTKAECRNIWRRMWQVRRARHRPGVFAAMPRLVMQVGLARELLFKYNWASEAANTIILPLGTARTDTLAAALATAAADARSQNVDLRRQPYELEVDVASRVPLSAEELAVRQAEEDAKRAAEEVRLLVLVPFSSWPR